MNISMLVALLGVLVAVMGTEFNDTVVATALTDVNGAFGISHDPGSWVESLYNTGLAIGMAFAPWFAVTFTLRRFTFFAIALACAATVSVPFVSGAPALLILRVAQGLAGGFTIPLLMTTAFRALPPPIRLYGLAVYALTATFTPNISATLAALWTDVVGWKFMFLSIIPLDTLAAVLVWHGMPHDPPQYERLQQFDWRGALLLITGFGALTTMLMQGDRLDWFNSPLISMLALVSVVAVPLLLVNEWFHPLPLLKLQMLERRNFAYGMIVLFTFLIITMSAVQIPQGFLTDIQGYRPLQGHLTTLLIALGQFLMLPAMALLLDRPWVDARIVNFLGFSLLLTACFGAAGLDGSWNREQFYLWQVLQMLGQPMVVMPLLMMATNTVRGPAEGPFASALINTARALSESVGIWVFDLVQRWRGAYHTNAILNQVGPGRFQHHLSATVPNYASTGSSGLSDLARRVTEQASIMTYADEFIVMGALCIALMILVLILPQRTLPPRVLFSKH